MSKIVSSYTTLAATFIIKQALTFFIAKDLIGLRLNAMAIDGSKDMTSK